MDAVSDLRLPQLVVVPDSSYLPTPWLALQLVQYAAHECFAPYCNALGPLGLSRLLTVLDSGLDPLSMAGAKLVFASEAATLDELRKIDQAVSQRRILDLSITAVCPLRGMLDHPVSHHVQVDIYECFRRVP